MALFTNLPPGSATHREMEPEAWAWTSTEELLALQAELLDAIGRVLMAANSPKGTKLPKPIDIQRPGSQRKQGTTVEDLLKNARRVEQ